MAQQLPRIRSHRLHAVARSSATSIYVVVYDITHPASLQRIGKYMEQYGYLRWQKSVWLGAHPPNKIPGLHKTLKAIFTLPEMEGSQLAWTKMLSTHLMETGYMGKSPHHTMAMACGKINFWYFD